jgi:hypothetical protein
LSGRALMPRVSSYLPYRYKQGFVGRRTHAAVRAMLSPEPHACHCYCVFSCAAVCPDVGDQAAKALRVTPAVGWRMRRDGQDTFRQTAGTGTRMSLCCMHYRSVCAGTPCTAILRTGEREERQQVCQDGIIQSVLIHIV